MFISRASNEPYTTFPLRTSTKRAKGLLTNVELGGGLHVDIIQIGAYLDDELERPELEQVLAVQIYRE